MAFIDETNMPSHGSKTEGQQERQHQQLPGSTTVLIVGGGSVGILSAIALSRYGMDCVVLERHATRMGQPKAHVINSRTVEIFRQYGLDMSYLREVGLSEEEAENVLFASSMNGVQYGRLKTKVASAAAKAASPEVMFNVAQPLLEDHMLKAALKTGKVTYLRMHEWQNCTEDPTSKEITSVVLVRESGATCTINSKYLIACDGTNAGSREVLQIPFHSLNNGPEVALHYISVHFSADLTRYTPGLLWFILNPAGMGVFIAYNRKNSWVFTTQYDPSVTPPAMFTSEFLKAKVFHAAGTTIDDYRELGITLWKTSPKVAEFYRSKTVPHAFLAGDAAHSFPPTGGLGLNTGVGDLHNLAWKIYAVEKGWVPDSFLDTVTPERWAIANDNSKQSKLNEEKIFRLVIAILKAGQTPEQHMADESTRKEIESAIQDQSDHFDSLNLVLGYVYGREHIRGPSDYVKECVPGARLPHDWIENSAGVRQSTLDLVDGYSFVLLASPGFTTEKMLDIQGVPVSVVQLDRDFVDSAGEWTKVLGLTTEAGVLVRPDQHIVGKVGSIQEVSVLLDGYWKSAQK